MLSCMVMSPTQHTVAHPPIQPGAQEMSSAVDRYDRGPEGGTTQKSLLLRESALRG